MEMILLHLPTHFFMGLSLIFSLLYNVKTIAQGCIANAKYHRMEGIAIFSFFLFYLYFLSTWAYVGVVVWCLRPRASWWDTVVSSKYTLFCYKSNGQPKLSESKICKSCWCSTTLKFSKKFLPHITQSVIGVYAIW
jgi:hypothetical protein